MVIRKGVLTLDEWNSRIHELLLDIGKETDVYSIEVYDLLIETALDFRDARKDDNDKEF